MLAVHRNPAHPDNQQGWVLVVGLVILVMLTILSIALMKTTRLEEKMAGATRDMNLSFQAAETALRRAENFILIIDTNPQDHKMLFQLYQIEQIQLEI